MVFNWFHFSIILFLLAGIGFAAFPIIVALLFSPKAKGGAYSQPYECGMTPHGGAWTRIGVTYYLYALLFLAFDVDVLYLFPAAVFYNQSVGFIAFWEVFIFVFVLVVAGLYFYRKGIFTWPRKIKI